MKKKWLSSLLIGSLCLAFSFPGTTYADGQKVVTLGADLTEDQRTAVLKYFGVLGQNIHTLTITNQDERDHLGSYVPLEQIGTRTFSCALVCPTNSGGIQVKTANLSWVTSNMIASTLSTSGVRNCDVLAASPFEVSGTGALTGVIMAYEAASGTTLDANKKELATQELVTTTTIASEIGQQQATSIVNEIKIQVIEGAVVEPEQVEEIVDQVIDENPEVLLSDEDRALLYGLMTQIAEQDYDYNEMRETLERVEENVSSLEDKIDKLQSDLDDSETKGEELIPVDSILVNTDDSALGEGVIIDATTEDVLPETEKVESDTSSDPFEIVSSDSYGEADTISGNEDITIPDNVGDDNITPADDNDNVGEEITWPENGESGGEPAWPENSGSDGEITWPENGESGEAPAWPDDSEDTWSDDTSDNGSDIAVSDNNGSEDIWTDNTDDGGDAWSENADSSEDTWSENTDNGENAWTDDSTDEDGYTDPDDANDTWEETEPAPVEIPALSLTDVKMNPDESAAAGINQIRIYTQNDNIVLVSGTLLVTDESDNEIARVDLSDKERAAAFAMTDKDKDAFLWNSGTELLIYLGKALQPFQSYSISVEAAVAETSDPAVLENVPVGNISERWDVYVDGNGVSVDITSTSDVRPGAVLSGAIAMDDAAVFAEISDYDAEKLSFDVTQFQREGNADFTVTCYQSGKTTFTVDYYDAEDNWIGSAEYALTVQ